MLHVAGHFITTVSCFWRLLRKSTQFLAKPMSAKFQMNVTHIALRYAESRQRISAKWGNP